MKINTVLFDLDGTLIDTAPDLARALNEVLIAQGRQAMPFEAIRPFVSHGATALINFGFPDIDSDLQVKLRQDLIDSYAADIAKESRLFPGMADFLAHLTSNDYNWGIVTNKPEFLTHKLLKALDLTENIACVVGGDTLEVRKPHPKPLLYACETIGVSSDSCIYIGDAKRDVESAKAAGMQALVALFGYIGEEDMPHNWGADGLIAHIDEVYQWLK